MAWFNTHNHATMLAMGPTTPHYTTQQAPHTHAAADMCATMYGPHLICIELFEEGFRQ